MRIIQWRPSLRGHTTRRRTLAVGAVALVMLISIIIVTASFFSGPVHAQSQSASSIAVPFTTQPPASIRTDMFVIGSDSALWHRWSEHGLWSPWESLGGTLTGQPAVVVHGTTIEVFAYDLTSNGILWRTYTPATNLWSDWKNVSAPTNFNAHIPAATVEPDGTVDLLMTGYQSTSSDPFGHTSRTLFLRQLHTDGTWSAWQTLWSGVLPNGGVMGVPAVAVSATGRLDVAVVDTLNAFAWYQSFVSGQGSGWQNISANVSASIFQTDDGDNVSYGLSMASVVPGRLDMFGSSGAGSLFHARFVNGQWSPTNSSQGVPGASQTPGIAQSPDLTELFNLYIAPPIPGSVNPTVLERSEDANGGTTGWLDLGGPNITNVPAGISGPAVVAWNDPVSATPSPGTPPTPVVTPTPTPFPTTPTPTATPVPTLQGTYQGTMTQDTTRQQHTFTMQVTQSGSNLRGTLTIAGAPSPLRFSGSINSQGQVSITGANVQPVELATFSGVLDNTGRVSGRYSATFAGSSSSGGFSMTPV